MSEYTLENEWKESGAHQHFTTWLCDKIESMRDGISDMKTQLRSRAEAAEARAANLAEDNRELSESVKTLRAERAQLREALNGMIYGWRDYANGHYCQTYNPGMMQGLNCAADALEAFVSGLDMISATAPASHAEQEA